MQQPRALSWQLKAEFEKANANRNWKNSRECWCPEQECRWRDTDAECPFRPLMGEAHRKSVTLFRT